jgi:KUP system potassium uptake protein
VVVLVLGFRSSENLAAAYGIAVTGAMAIDSGLALVYMVAVRRWPPVAGALLFGLFLSVDLAFFGANLFKFIEGGWFPLLVAALIFMLMSTWMAGRAKLGLMRSRDALPLEMFLGTLRPDRPIRVPGTAVFLTGNVDVVPTHLLHNMKHNKVLHERIVLLHVRTEDVPRVPDEDRLEIRHLAQGCHTLVIRYGFMDEPSIPRALAQCRREQFRFNLLETSFFLGREKLVPAQRTGRITRVRTQLFIFLQNEMLNATEFFRLPTNRVIEVGGQFEI